MTATGIVASGRDVVCAVGPRCEHDTSIVGIPVHIVIRGAGKLVAVRILYPVQIGIAKRTDSIPVSALLVDLVGLARL